MAAINFSYQGVLNNLRSQWPMTDEEFNDAHTRTELENASNSSETKKNVQQYISAKRMAEVAQARARLLSCGCVEGDSPLDEGMLLTLAEKADKIGAYNLAFQAHQKKCRKNVPAASVSNDWVWDASVLTRLGLTRLMYGLELKGLPSPQKAAEDVKKATSGIGQAAKGATKGGLAGTVAGAAVGGAAGALAGGVGAVPGALMGAKFGAGAGVAAGGGVAARADGKHPGEAADLASVLRVYPYHSYLVLPHGEKQEAPPMPRMRIAVTAKGGDLSDLFVSRALFEYQITGVGPKPENYAVALKTKPVVQDHDQELFVFTLFKKGGSITKNSAPLYMNPKLEELIRKTTDALSGVQIGPEDFKRYDSAAAKLRDAYKAYLEGERRGDVFSFDFFRQSTLIQSKDDETVPLAFPSAYIHFAQSKVDTQDGKISLTPHYTVEEKGDCYEVSLIFGETTRFIVASFDKETVDSYAPLQYEPQPESGASQVKYSKELDLNQFLIEALYCGMIDGLGMPGNQSAEFAPVLRPFPGVYTLLCRGAEDPKDQALPFVDFKAKQYNDQCQKGLERFAIGKIAEHPSIDWLLPVSGEGVAVSEQE